MSGLADPALAAKVPFALVDDFMRALGAEPTEVETILIDADGITLTTFRKDAEGHMYAAGRYPAKTITTIGFEPRPRKQIIPDSPTKAAS